MKKLAMVLAAGALVSFTAVAKDAAKKDAKMANKAGACHVIGNEETKEFIDDKNPAAAEWMKGKHTCFANAAAAEKAGFKAQAAAPAAAPAEETTK